MSCFVLVIYGKSHDGKRPGPFCKQQLQHRRVCIWDICIDITYQILHSYKPWFVSLKWGHHIPKWWYFGPWMPWLVATTDIAMNHEAPHKGWSIIIFNGSWLNSMGRCPPLRRPTQSSAKLVFVTSAAVEIHGNPRRFEWATNLHCHLWWLEGNSLLYPVSFYFHYHYCYYDSMPTRFDMICSGQKVGWCGVDVKKTRWIWRLDASALSATHHLPRPWVASWGSHSGGVGSRKATTFTDDLWWFTC